MDRMADREEALRASIQTQPPDVRYLLGVVEAARQAHTRDNMLNARALESSSNNLSKALRDNEALRADLAAAGATLREKGIKIVNLSTGEEYGK